MYRILFLFFLFSTVFATAQQKPQEEFDSLKRVLSNAKEDTNKIKILYRIAFLFQSNLDGYITDISPDTGLKYAQEGLELSEKLNFEKGLFNSKLFLGRIYWRKGIFSLAVKYHLEVLKYAVDQGDQNLIGYISVYIGQDYADDGKYQDALRYMENARTAYVEAKDTSSIANTLLLLAWVYSSSGDYPQSSKHNLEALRLYEATNDPYGAAIATSNVADDFYKLERFEESIEYLKRSSEICKKFKDFVNLAGNYNTISTIYVSLGNLKEAMYYARMALRTGTVDVIGKGISYSKIAEVYFLESKYDSSAYYRELSIAELKSVNAKQMLAIEYGNLAINYLRLNQKKKAKTALDSAGYFSHSNNALPALEKYYNGIYLFDSLSNNWKNAYFNFYKYVNTRDTINNIANTKKLMRNQVQYDFDKKEAATRAEQEKKDIRQRTIRNSIAGVLAGSLIFLIVVYRQRNKINKARKRSDELLLNILPEEVAEELKKEGRAKARHFDEVTVMFTDFKDFTTISEKLSPTELVDEIHTCFKAFDEITGKYNIEKIKTIGDSYMCAGGLPIPNKSHAEDVVKAALDIRQFMLRHLEEKKNSRKEIFEIRIGIHTGQVVAGIVGVKKFAYDIWGDTVNIAARMEQNSESGKINISNSTYLLVKDKFTCFHRGKIKAKNKGEIDMYFLEG